MALISLSTLTATSQINLTFEMGGETIAFSAKQLLKDNGGEETFYTIQDGFFSYHYVNEFEGEIIQYKMYQCRVDKLDYKSISMKAYEGETQFLYVKTKKNEKEVAFESWALDDKKILKREDYTNQIMLIIPSEAIGETIKSQIKKGKNF